MFRFLVDFCLRFRGVVIALACVVLVYGIEVARSAKLDVFPEFVPPQVVVQTEAPGLAAEQVEMLAGLSSRLPLGVHPPTMSALTSSTMDLLKIGLVSDRLSTMALRSFADWTLRPRLLAVPGVAQATVFGGEVRQLQIQVQPERLLGHGLTITDVLTAARASTGIVGA